jgi:RNA polymerase sigma-70 factor, ECF subfamily
MPPRRTVIDDDGVLFIADENRILELVNQALKGNNRAWAELERLFKQILHNSIKRRIRSPETAEDIYQEAWIKAYIKLPDLREPKRFGGWLYRIALNCIRDHWRTEQRQAPQESTNSEEIMSRILDLAPRPDELVEANELAQIIRSATNQLSETQRAILILKYYDGLSYAEIAEVLGKPVSTIRSNHRHAIQSLREQRLLISYTIRNL